MLLRKYLIFQKIFNRREEQIQIPSVCNVHLRGVQR